LIKSRSLAGLPANYHARGNLM